MEALMSSVGSYEAKTRLPELLKRTAKGERITITKHGVSVAVLVPARSLKKRNIGDLIQEIREFRRGHTLEGMSLREMIDEGRRF
jgi:prevent-host-death family protein